MQALGADRRYIVVSLSRSSQRRIEPPKVELVSPFSRSRQKCGIVLQPIEYLIAKVFLLHLGLKSCVVVTAFVAYSK